MGLRERKKQRTREALLAAAAELAAERDFDRVRVRDVVERVEVSEATFFKYFPAKHALLDAWVEQELANAFAGFDAAARGPRLALRDAVRALAAQATATGALARTAWSRARIHAAASATVRAGHVAPALRRAQRDGELRSDVSAQELAELLLCAVGAALSLALGEDRPAPEPGGAAAAARACRAGELVLDGARKRHERVRVRPPAPRAAPL